jgi:hypothetical protein
MSVKLSSLIKRIKAAKSEAEKASLYSEGYLDCIKDLLNEETNDINKMIGIKFDAKIREEVYSEILPTLEDIESSSQPIQNTSALEQPPLEGMHPSDRAKSFMERIGRK